MFRLKRSTNLSVYSYYVRIAAAEAQEPTSGIMVIVNDSDDGLLPGRSLQYEAVIR